MAEAFVKTFKRGHAIINDRPDAKTVMGCLNDWLNDYNENYPLKGLKLKSPRKFMREVTAALC